jgi:hypothetical protein
MWGKQDIDVALIAFEPWILLEEFMAYRFVLFPKWNAPCGTLSILDASMALSIYYADNAGGGGGGGSKWLMGVSGWEISYDEGQFTPSD